MKIINKILIASMFLTLASCDNLFELDLLDNPNQVTKDKAGVDFLYNNIQREFNQIYYNFQNIGDGLSRLTELGTQTYVSALGPTAGNGAWNNVYADFLPDIDAMLNLAEERGLYNHAGSAKIMKAYVLTTMVDFFGDVPYSEALQGTDIIAPTADPGADIYAAAEALLDEGIANLTDNPNAASPAADLIYGGDATKWVTAANTLKLRLYSNMRLVDSGAGAKMMAIINGGDYIDEESEDFDFHYGTNRDNPNSRHPFYNGAYESSDLFPYMNTYYMWLMLDEKEIVDPRIRFYFKRQTSNALELDGNVYSCVYSIFPDPAETPQHFLDVDPRMPYCALPQGYFGRDHGNGQGIPPDGPIKTVYGIYPGGGEWDNQSFTEAQQSGTTGGLGQGISPVWQSSFTDFIRAEAALEAGTGEDARALLESAVRKSIAKVTGFASLAPASELNYQYGTDIDGNPLIASESFVPTSEDIDAYVAKVLENYDSANDKLDVVMKEYLIAMFGNGIEGYNMYRRTGKPNNMMPGLELGIGEFARSLLYPSDHVNLNANVSQKSILDRVFWDDGSASCR